MTENKLREILRGGGSSICTRISSRWGLITELAPTADATTTSSIWRSTPPCRWRT